MVIIAGILAALIRPAHTHTNIATSYQHKGPKQQQHTLTYSFLFKFVSRFHSFRCCCVDCLVLCCVVLCLVFYISLPCNQFVLISFFFSSSRSRRARSRCLSIHQIRWIRFRFIAFTHCALFDGMTTRNTRNKYRKNTKAHTHPLATLHNVREKQKIDR